MVLIVSSASRSYSRGIVGSMSTAMKVEATRMGLTGIKAGHQPHISRSVGEAHCEPLHGWPFQGSPPVAKAAERRACRIGPRNQHSSSRRPASTMEVKSG